MIDIFRIIFIIVAIVCAIGLIFLLVFDGNINKMKKKKDEALSKVNKGSKSSEKSKAENSSKTNEKKSSSKSEVIKKSFKDLIEFDDIVQSFDKNPIGLICREEHTEFVGGIEVKGLNFNLLSLQERENLERAFNRLLNGIDYPVQIMIQSRRLEIEGYLAKYEKRVNEFKKKLEHITNKIQLLKVSIVDDNKEQMETLNKLKDEYNKALNQYQYGLKLLDDISEKCSNKNMIEKRYFILFTHIHNPKKYQNEQTKKEILANAFYDISNKANALLIALSRAKHSGKILSGVDLAELIYISYNKSDSEFVKLRSSIENKYDSYYVTADSVEIKSAKRELEELQQEEKEILSELNKNNTKELLDHQ